MWLYLSDSFIYGLLSTLQCLISFPSREKNMFLQMSGFLISWRMKCFFIRKLSSFSWSNKPIKKPKTGCFSDSKSSWLVFFFVFFLSFCCFLLFFLKICSPHRTATLQIYDDLRNMMHCCKWHEPMIYKVVKTSSEAVCQQTETDRDHNAGDLSSATFLAKIHFCPRLPQTWHSLSIGTQRQGGSLQNIE